MPASAEASHGVQKGHLRQDLLLQQPPETAAVCSAVVNPNRSYISVRTLITDKELHCFSGHSSNKLPQLGPCSLADLGLYHHREWAPVPLIQLATGLKKFPHGHRRNREVADTRRGLQAFCSLRSRSSTTKGDGYPSPGTSSG